MFIAAAPFVPDQPTGVAGTLSSSNNRHVDVAFSAPSDTGGASVTAYYVYSIPTGPKDPFTGSSSPITWEGSSSYDGESFRFYVKAQVCHCAASSFNGNKGSN